ncbi:MAG: putative pyridoxal-dependent aspartate 1-decarboxylase [Desulfobacter postgatei]|uniref:Putative pyridoxal-dependent aspartate 1-decarboxylase n=1 Tax=Desulfobacter postgatei TaxID=2293 RepID=A0A2G6MTR8_9BACT|nr:MAG: putative pyridoxal-dependent aspartate 1-decarboxylase [Desulfobacter postgatei]
MSSSLSFFSLHENTNWKQGHKNVRKTAGQLIADRKSLDRVFIRPDDENSKKTLVKYMEQILFGLHDFLNRHVGVTEEISINELAKSYMDVTISDHPQKDLGQVIEEIIKDVAPKAVNVASPYFIGHMTSALPFFMVHLKAITAALNQNVIKMETSKVLSVIERQVLAKIHCLIFKQSQAFYQAHVQNTRTALGAFTSGGTTANMTAMWVARNRLFPPKDDFSSIEEDGLSKAMSVHNTDRVVILVSCRGHYSLRKASGILGLGNKNIIALDIKPDHTIDTDKLKQTIQDLKQGGRTKIAAIVGIAGATETGTIDPLQTLADICEQEQIHFHVDAAWGGPILLSENYAHLLSGIERADSVTIDGHKQFYMPMGTGMLYFKNALALDAIAYHARYVNRKGSVDLGIKTLEGSREAACLILDASLKIMGSKGYALMIDHGIETARAFAKKIEARPEFELVTPPVLNILTYRMVPISFRKKMETAQGQDRKRLNQELDEINIRIQRIQREAGKSFVSRTRLKLVPEDDFMVVVLRSVIMNPYTTEDILDDILDEQEKIYHMF